MGQHVLPGNPPIDILTRRSARARRITLRVSGLDGRVTLTLPRGVAEREALDFARAKEPWLRKHLAKQVPPVVIEEGASLPFEGHPNQLHHEARRGVRHAGGALFLNLADGQGGPRLRAWLKAQARTRLSVASDHYAARLGRPFSKITLRDTRSRWGSCSATGALSYSWRLIMAPPHVLDYVAAHEVAHLAQMNHSQAFWDEVHALYGPHDTARRWLRTEGSALHAISFDPQ
ncbi:M48 family metallopeptidase [Roseobacteraceae bacterium S113]